MLTQTDKLVPQMQPELAAPNWTLTNTPPLWPLEFFTVALNVKMQALIDDCDAGRFGHVWDISSRRQNAEGKNMPRR